MKKSCLLGAVSASRTLRSTAHASLKKLFFTLVFGASLAGFIETGEASAITTQPSWDGASTFWRYFGDLGTMTYGQTFTVTGSDTVLDKFSFWYDDELDPDFVDFAAYVYAWDGAMATGPSLFASSMVSSTNNGGLGGVERFNFLTGGIQLVAGQRYVAFTSAFLFSDGIRGTAAAGGSGLDEYAGGSFVHTNSDVSGWTTQPWAASSIGVDTAFEAVFSAPVPVPPSVWLFGSGLLGLIGIARRKT